MKTWMYAVYLIAVELIGALTIRHYGAQWYLVVPVVLLIVAPLFPIVKRRVSQSHEGETR